MSDDDHLSPEDRELEAELKRLSPSNIKADFFDELIRDQQRIEDTKRPAPHRSRRMISVLAACAVVFAGSTFLKIRNAGSGDESIAANRKPTPATENRTNDFVPVSSEGYLINAASGGIVDSENGPREQFELRYEDVEHWHNPDTATTIRIFSPRREIITVPVQTD